MLDIERYLTLWDYQQVLAGDAPAMCPLTPSALLFGNTICSPEELYQSPRSGAPGLSLV